jgi:hypothetical protein
VSVWVAANAKKLQFFRIVLLLEHILDFLFVSDVHVGLELKPIVVDFGKPAFLCGPFSWATASG